ncbi:hypothetical protein D1114_07190 [Cereibacter sphaeroides]|uniref:Uncharacterized protein n=1 Tax=Cereibacter sphaeroides TaxID=1063 RepID=A0AAX1UNC8_CERSP|nr:hypothetical protein D1114_07190 [Cereibacter sphaeroides]
MGDVADFLFQRATCKDFTSALSKAQDPDQTTEEMLIVLLGLVYSEGFASGTGRGRDARADMIVRCAMSPSARFNNIDE